MTGSWSSGYDVSLTRRRSPVRIRLSPLFSSTFAQFVLNAWTGGHASGWPNIHGRPALDWRSCLPTIAPMDLSPNDVMRMPERPPIPPLMLSPVAHPMVDCAEDRSFQVIRSVEPDLDVRPVAKGHALGPAAPAQRGAVRGEVRLAVRALDDYTALDP